MKIKKRYLRSIDERRIKDNEIRTALDEGEAIGLEKGEAIGLEKGEIITLERIVMEGHRNGFSLDQIQLLTNLTHAQISEILKHN